RRLQTVDDPLEADPVLVLRLRPLRHVGVVEAEDAKRWLAAYGHDRQDRFGRLGEAGETDFVGTYAVDVVRVIRVEAAPDRVRAEESDHDLRAAQPVLDLLFPLFAGSDLARVLPDFKAPCLQVGPEPSGQRRGVAAAVAEKQPGPHR